jgi:DNA repair ATPase RecN
MREGDTSTFTTAEADARAGYLKDMEEAAQAERRLKEERKKSYATEEERAEALDKANREQQEAIRKAEEYEAQLKELGKLTNLDDLFKKLKEMNIPLDGIEKTKEGVKQLAKDLEDTDSKAYKQLLQDLTKIANDSEEAEKWIEELRKEFHRMSQEDENIKKLDNEMENLKNQVLQFFSISNAIDLFKRAV